MLFPREAHKVTKNQPSNCIQYHPTKSTKHSKKENNQNHKSTQMYSDGDISDIFAQCREHYNSAAIDEGGGNGDRAEDQQGEENNENSNESQRQRGRRAADGSSSLSSIERSIGSNGASSGGYEASSSSSSSQTPNIANGRSGSKPRRFEHHVKKPSAGQHIHTHTHTHADRRRSSGALEAALADVLAPAQGSAAPPTKCVSFTGTVKPPCSYNNRKHLRDRAGHDDDEPACKASELDSKERAGRKNDPNDDDTSTMPDPESEKHMMEREQALAQHQLLQGNEVTIEQAMTLCRQPRILTLSSEPFVVVHVNASFTKLSGLDAHIINGMPVETVFYYSQPSASASGKAGCNGNNGNDAESSSSASSNTAVVSNWIAKSDLCNDRVVDIIVRERLGNDVGGSRDEDMLSSRFQGTRRCRLMISKVCSFERSSSSSSSSSGSSTGGSGGSGGSGFSSREASNAELSSGEDAGIAPDSTSASEDMVLDDGGEPPLQKTTTHYLLQLHPCQLLVGPHAPSKASAGRTEKSYGKRRGGSGGGDETMYVIG